MSWHYLRERVAVSWEGSCLDGAPDALLRLMPIAGGYCSQDSGTDACQGFQYGTTCPPSTVGHGVDMLISSPGVSHAKILARQDAATAFRAKGQGFGGNGADMRRGYAEIHLRGK